MVAQMAIAKHFRDRGFHVNVKGVKAGNAVIDEVVGKNWRPAPEIGYNSALVSLRHANTLDPAAFTQHNIVVLGLDPKAQIHQVYQ